MSNCVHFAFFEFVIAQVESVSVLGMEQKKNKAQKPDCVCNAN